MEVILTNWLNVYEVFGSGETCELYLFLLCNVLSFYAKSNTMVKIDSLLVVSADVEAKVGWILLKEILEEFSADSLTLAARSNTNSHEISSQRHLNVMFSLQLSLLLHI